MSEQNTMIYLKDYQAPAFLIDQVQLHVDLYEDETVVRSILTIRRNPARTERDLPLELNGEELKLNSIALNGKALAADQYQLDAEWLRLPQVPDQFTLETSVSIDPKNNQSLTGLYQSNGNYCTQCEAEGFRRITYFPDRPDVMSHYSVAISADKKRYPILLSNGNLIEEKELPDNRHWVLWEDPSLKPCYLFALVAGNFEFLQGHFITCSNRSILLRVYVERGNLSQANFALESLKRAMRWDEERYGREYDLDQYMIVAVGDFNMGAMENKGLNIFNTKYVLANSKSATDLDYMGIESVIGHEYFHNWTGNRITCRDWFQITLKEGLTVFRDQGFSSDMGVPLLQRINAVNTIRNAQFPQDAGPISHPIRPDHYEEINNFYTVTVYNKGAEVIRMIETLIGKDNFRKGMDLYFERHDGQAVTTEEFVKAMEDASAKDLTQFRRWYSQSGTPVLEVSSHYDAAQKTYTLKVNQICSATSDQKEKQMLHIPLKIALLDEKAQEMPLQLKAEGMSIKGPRVLEIKEAEQEFCFVGIDTKPTPSLLRHFSAPVILNYSYTMSELLWLIEHDTDDFNRWDAAQRASTQLCLSLIREHQAQKELVLDMAWIQLFSNLLTEAQPDGILLEKLLTLPSENYLAQQIKPADIGAIHTVRQWLKREIAQHLEKQLLTHYQRLNKNVSYEYDVKEMGERALKNICLYYLLIADKERYQKIALDQFHQANNMTDTMGALVSLNDHDTSARERALMEFYAAWKGEALVVDKWLMLQASSSLDSTLSHVKQLLSHPAFDLKNPNKVRALISCFSANQACFHQVSGEGYRFVADQVIEIDCFNPQLAARIVEPLLRWQHLDEPRQVLMRGELERIKASKTLSKNVDELVTRGLA